MKLQKLEGEGSWNLDKMLEVAWVGFNNWGEEDENKLREREQEREEQERERELEKQEKLEKGMIDLLPPWEKHHLHDVGVGKHLIEEAWNRISVLVARD